VRPARPTAPVVAEVERSGVVESVHHGSAVALSADGDVVVSIGAPDDPVFPRSCLKPLQAAAMVRAGLSLDGPQLAVVAASHSGEPKHLDLVRSILASAGLDASALDNAVGMPLSADAARAVVRAGGEPARLYQNCSGKHAGMLATCVAAGWPTAGYRAPEHPVQQAIRDGLEALVGRPPDAVGVDGCGAPVFAFPLVGIARAMTRLVCAAPGTPERRVADAMRAHPDVVGGTGRDVTALMTGVPGLLAKDGAEGCAAAALADGSAAAVKIGDGGGRARTPVLVALLRRLGVDAPVLDELATVPVYGGGAVVGEVRASV
jgi:L-asparaginase II